MSVVSRWRMAACLAGADWWTYDLAYLTTRIYSTCLYCCYLHCQSLHVRPCDTNHIPTARPVTYPASESTTQTPSHTTLSHPILPITFHILTSKQALRPSPDARLPLQRPNGSNYSVKTPSLYRCSQGQSILASLLDTTTTEAYPLAGLPPRARGRSYRPSNHPFARENCSLEGRTKHAWF
jgi:hypothetical protein